MRCEHTSSIKAFLKAPLSLLLSLFVVISASWAFIEIADEVMEGETTQIDERVLAATRNPHDLSDPLGPKWLEELGRDLTAMGGPAVLTILTAIVAVFLIIRRQFQSLAFLLFATIGAVLLSSLLKVTFARPRPDAVYHLTHVATYSFPSGHSMHSASVYLTQAVLLAQLERSLALKIYFIGVALVLTFLVGISRIYLGVHYLTDVVAGWAVGIGWGIFCWLSLTILRKRGFVEAADERSPS